MNSASATGSTNLTCRINGQKCKKTGAGRRMTYSIGLWVLLVALVYNS